MDTILGIIERTLEVYRMEGPQDGKTTRAATEEIVALARQEYEQEDKMKASVLADGLWPT